MSRITINGISFDPLAPHPSIEASNFNAPDASGSNYILLQSKQPLDSAQKQQLAGLGVVILEYVPDDTYMCSYKPTDLVVIRNLPFVTWVNPYMQGFKINPSLVTDNSIPTPHSLEQMMVLPSAKFNNTLKSVDIVLHKDVDPESVRNKIAAAIHTNPESLVFGKHKVRISVQAKYLQNVAALDEVLRVEEVRPTKLLNDIARQIIWEGSPAGAINYQGAGQTVVVADTGFDKGSTMDVHPAFTGRVTKIYDLGRPGLGNDPDGHGTHVAGSVLGTYNSATLGTTVAGMAPGANLIVQSLLDSGNGLGGLPADLHDLFTPPYLNDGARIHSNSWGSDPGDSRYDSPCSEVDDFVWNNRNFVICFAAGNEGKDTQGTGVVSTTSLTSPAAAKNCITVGATENTRPNFTLTYNQGWPSDFPANPIASDPVANNSEGMAAFSSRGPTQDNRIKPDLVAPGTYILSTLSRDVPNPSGWSTSPDPLFFYDGGTSMATPLVAGSVAVIREYLNSQQNTPNPSAALVKALLINGAKMISGQYIPSETGPIPSISDGFGRVDLTGIATTFTPPANLVLKDENTALDTNDQEQWNLNVPNGISLLKVTLVWTDLPGLGLQNDLDLIITHSNGTELHGNMASGNASFDRNNNVEQVTWQGVPSGNITVTVKAFRIAQSKQTYALVVRMA